MGKPFQATRGFYLGKKREAAKRVRYRLRDLCDEDGIPDLPGTCGKSWIRNGGKCWRCLRNSHGKYEIILRNRRKFMRKRKRVEFEY